MVLEVVVFVCKCTMVFCSGDRRVRSVVKATCIRVVVVLVCEQGVELSRGSNRTLQTTNTNKNNIYLCFENSFLL